MRIVELPSENPKPRHEQPRLRRVYRTTEAVYKGPPNSFPYDAFRALGIAQLVLGSLLCLIGLVQTTVSYEDRAVVLVSGAVVIWCPLFAISAGVVGMLFSKKRYWEVECMKAGFIVTSSIAALLMLVMIAVVIFVQFYYYDVINLEPVDTFNWLDKNDIAEDDGYKAMVILVVVLAALEFLVAVISASMGCCFAEIYEPDSKLEKRQVKPQSQISSQQQTSEEVRYRRKPDVEYVQQPQRVSYVQEPVMQFVQEPTMQFVQEPTMQFVQEPTMQFVQEAPMQFVQEPTMQFVQEPGTQYVQQPVQLMAQPSPLKFANPQVMASPPPSLLYVV